MKKRFFGLLLLPALLVSCKTNNKDDATSNNETNNNETEVKKPTLRTWSENEISLMKENLNDFTMPSFTANEGSWIFDEEYECLTYKTTGNKEDVDKIYSELINSTQFESIAEPGVVEDSYASEVAHYFPETEIVSYVDVDIYINNSDLYVDAYYFYYYKDWNEKAIKEILTSLDLPDATIPKPNFEITAFEIDETYILEGIFTLFCHSETDKSNEYKAQLDSLKYISKPTEYEGTTYDFKVDPVSKLALDVYFDADYGDTVIDVYVGLFDDLNAK